MGLQKTELFGSPITQSPRLTLTQQVFDILVEEIQRGRWEIGERLPSITELAQQSGLSRAPIQHALDMLAEAGYIRQESRRGTFLASLLPKGREPVGVIGVAILRQSLPNGIDPDPGRAVLLHRLMEALAERNYLVEVQYLDADYPWAAIPTRNGPFSHRVRGIVSLHPFQHISLVRQTEEEVAPLVFLGTISPGSLPCASGNNFIGGSLLTQRLIELGHRKIVVFCKSSPIDYSQQRFLEGHRQAMVTSGLTVNQHAIEDSIVIEPFDLSGYRHFLEKYSDATAIIAMTESAAQAISSVARMLGLSIPRDLSLACQGRVSMADDPNRMMFSIEYPTETVVRIALEMLEEMLRLGRCEISQVLTMPLLYEGETIAAPKDGQQDTRDMGTKATRPRTALPRRT